MSRALPAFPSHNVLLLGPPKAGKSTVGNLLAGERVFSTGARNTSTLHTKEHKFTHGHSTFRVIDTIGIGEEGKPVDDVTLEWTMTMLMAANAGGIHCFLICVDVQSLAFCPKLGEVEDLAEMKDFWPHAILLFTSASPIDADERRLDVLLSRLEDSTPALRTLKGKIQDRILFVALDDSGMTGSTSSSGSRPVLANVSDILGLITKTSERGTYMNAMMRDASECWDRYQRIPCESEVIGYENLAIKIVRVPHGGSRIFYRIWHGIREIIVTLRPRYYND